MKLWFERTIILPVLISAFALVSFGQTTTARLTGLVTDATGAAVPEAKITATHTATGLQRTSSSGPEGYYTIPLLERGSYQVSVQKSGFRPIIRELTLDVGQIARMDFVLEVGEITEKVTVTAAAPLLQTASAERAGTITSSQVDNLLIRGRNVTSLVQLLPGVVTTVEYDSLSREYPGLYAAGNRANANNLLVEGLSVNGTGHMGGAMIALSQDAVAEVKMLISNYQAEYGRMAGATISVVTKSGTREFHGLGSYFKRHEQFNANNFFNNRLGFPKPRYRYHTWTYNIAGPVYIPGKFNRNRDKLFFSWTQEFWPMKIPQGIRQVTVPTERERAGDFSESLDLNDKLIVINDPDTSGQPFPGNRIPASRIDPNGQALLKIFPAPNFFDRRISGGRYNYVFESVNRAPQRTGTLRLDCNLNSSNLLSGTFTRYTFEQEGYVGIPTAASNWPQMRKTFGSWVNRWQVRYQHIFSPHLVNEFNIHYVPLYSADKYREEDLARNQRDKVGFKTGQFNPAINPLNIIPDASFGGVPSAAILNTEKRFPHFTNDNTYGWSDNVTWIRGSHTTKLGVYADGAPVTQRGTSVFNGSFSFGRDVNNPLETGYAYSNAALGVFQSYTESSGRVLLDYRIANIEWFAQDNWKLTRRLALDYGLRFYLIPPIHERDNEISGFVPDRWDPSRQVQLIRPGLVAGRRVGIHPVTGQIFPPTLIGAIAAGTGDPANGMVVSGQDRTYPRALRDDRGVHLGPRIGFAYDPFGKGKTAIRGGFGVFYNREDFGSTFTGLGAQMPLVQNSVINYNRLSTLLSARGVLLPQNVTGVDRTGKTPTVMNFSLSVQQNVGWGTVVDVGYVGSLGRHLIWRRNLNAIPFGTNFNPANADPANPAVPLPPAFLSPRIGYSTITFIESAASSNYHSLQLSANRRMAGGLQLGAAWTWSKAMDFNDSNWDWVSTLVPVRVWNYGLAAFDRTHVVKLNWVWDVPKTPWKVLPASLVLNGWQVSGISSFVSGAPLGVGFSTTVPMDITGSPTDGARIVVTGNPVLPKSQRTFSRNFRTEVFELPAKGTIGNAAKTLIRGPGINNWDVGIYKNFLVREPMRFQFRWEMYNAFNHTQFAGLDTTARFDPAGKQVNSRFGEFTSARNPRQMQFALRFYF